MLFAQGSLLGWHIHGVGLLDRNMTAVADTKPWAGQKAVVHIEALWTDLCDLVADLLLPLEPWNPLDAQLPSVTKAMCLLSVDECKGPPTVLCAVFGSYITCVCCQIWVSRHGRWPACSRMHWVPAFGHPPASPHQSLRYC